MERVIRACGCCRKSRKGRVLRWQGLSCFYDALLLPLEFSSRLKLIGKIILTCKTLFSGGLGQSFCFARKCSHESKKIVLALLYNVVLVL